MGCIEEGPTCNPSLPDSLISDFEKMRGDAIGDTLYSERWVLKTLIKITQFTDESWTEEFETELCSLWDMTLEPDVVTFLLAQNVFTIINDAIKLTNNSRFIEILVGLLGNMCCVEAVRREMLSSQTTLSLLLALLDQDEPHILIQLVRLLHSVAWDLTNESTHTATWIQSQLSQSTLSSRLVFILNSSTNEELLSCVLELLNTLCGLQLNDKDFSQYFSGPEMIQGLLECWRELYSSWGDGEDFPSKQLCKTASHWSNVLSSFTGFEAGRTILCHYGDRVGRILKRIVSRPDECIDEILISAVTVLDTILDVYFDGVVLKRLLNSLNFLYQHFGEGESGCEEERLERVLLSYIETYCVSVSNKVAHGELLQVLHSVPENHVLLFWKSVNDKQTEDSGERAV